MDDPQVWIQKAAGGQRFDSFVIRSVWLPYSNFSRLATLRWRRDAAAGSPRRASLLEKRISHFKLQKSTTGHASWLLVGLNLRAAYPLRGSSICDILAPVSLRNCPGHLAAGSTIGRTYILHCRSGRAKAVQLWYPFFYTSIHSCFCVLGHIYRNFDVGLSSGAEARQQDVAFMPQFPADSRNGASQSGILRTFPLVLRQTL